MPLRRHFGIIGVSYQYCALPDAATVTGQALPHVIAADLRGMDGLDILGAGASTPRNSVVVGFWNDY